VAIGFELISSDNRCSASAASVIALPLAGGDKKQRAQRLWLVERQTALKRHCSMR
jgi:hypothetical protein